MTQLYKPNEMVIIVYHDAKMKEEAGRGYPYTEEDLDDLMEWASGFEAWECITRAMVEEREQDLQLRRLAENLPDEEMPQASFERIWKNVEAAL